MKLPLKTLHIFILVFVITYGIVLLLKLYDYLAVPFIYNHLNDILVIPIVATACLHVVWWIKKDHSLRLGIVSLLSLVLLYSLYFECYLPEKMDRYTGDLWDVVCYGVGAVLFYGLQKIT